MEVKGYLLVVVVVLNVAEIFARNVNIEDAYEALGNLNLKSVNKKKFSDDYMLNSPLKKLKGVSVKEVELGKLIQPHPDGVGAGDKDATGSDQAQGHLIRKRRGWNLQYVNVKYHPAGFYVNDKVFRRNYDFYNEIPRYNERNYYRRRLF